MLIAADTGPAKLHLPTTESSLSARQTKAKRRTVGSASFLTSKESKGSSCMFISFGALKRLRNIGSAAGKSLKFSLSQLRKHSYGSSLESLESFLSFFSWGTVLAVWNPTMLRHPVLFLLLILTQWPATGGWQELSRLFVVFLLAFLVLPGCTGKQQKGK